MAMVIQLVVIDELLNDCQVIHGYTEYGGQVLTTTFSWLYMVILNVVANDS